MSNNTISFLSSQGGVYAALSNFYVSPFIVDGKEYATVEHYFQAAKFADHPVYAEKIRNARSPAEAKRLGQARHLSIVADWDRNRCAVMARGLEAKFANPALCELLLSTGNAKLVETNKHDSYWGIGDGHGANHLGRLLMKLRKSLQEK